MSRRIIVRKFDPIRPVYAAKPFTANGRSYEIGEELAWRELEVDKHRIRRMYDTGLLVHGDEKPRQEMVRERNMDSHKEPEKAVIGESKIEQSVIQKDTFPKHCGGPWYELSNGQQVKGKSKAEEAEDKLNG